MSTVRLAVVLSAGGIRGAAHLGVLRQLAQHRIPIDALVGVSAGAVVAGYYAAVGLDLDELIRDAEVFRGRHLVAHSLNVQLRYRFERLLAARSGVIPSRLRQLETARFDRLSHGVRALGIVCHDLRAGTPIYFATGTDRGVGVDAAVRASASIPYLFPPVSVICDGQEMRLTDGGLTDPLPVAFARSTAIGATHVVISDCRSTGHVGRVDSRTVWVRPRMRQTGTLWAPVRGLAAAVRDGEAAVTEATLDRIESWFAPDARASVATGRR
jgi:NTE family protein